VISMGGGSYSASNYAKRTATKINTGTTFGYDRTVRSTGVFKSHDELDPKLDNAAGVNIRESRDNPDNPNSVPIVVGFDATGSMGGIPRVAQKNLTNLFGLLLRKGYVENPAVSISAYGDAYYDRVPLQISQFEADNRIDDNLDNLFLEGGGGANGGETQTLLWYYLATHTATDAWDKRNKKGYLFIIGDEIALDLNANQVKDFIGDNQPLIPDLTAKGLSEAVLEKWDVTILLVDNTTAHYQGSKKFYEELFGKKNVIVLENADGITETIGLVLGAKEGNLDDLEQAEKDLIAVGASKESIATALSATKDLITVGSAGGTLAKGNLNLALDDDSDDGAL
jgi:hypothetical protein